MTRTLLTLVVGAIALSACAPAAHARAIIGVDRTLTSTWVSGWTEESGPRTLSVTRGGTVIAARTGSSLRVSALQPGDTITVSSRTITFRRTFDGQPTITRACAGSTRFLGTRAGDFASYESSGTYAPGADTPYGPRRPFSFPGRLGTSSATSMEILFDAPLKAGTAVFLATVIQDGANAYSSTASARVNAGCKDAANPLPVKLGLVGARTRAGLRSLRRGALSIKVRVPAAGPVTGTLLLTGKGPASRRLLARGRVTARKAGTVTIRLRSTKLGRRVAARRKRVKTSVTVAQQPRRGTRDVLVERLTLRR